MFVATRRAVVCRLSWHPCQSCQEVVQEPLDQQWPVVASLLCPWHGNANVGSSADLLNCSILSTPKAGKQVMNTPAVKVTL